jgi:cytochrome c oxidase subunit II
MATVESPVAQPRPGWARRFPTDERIFMWAVIASVVLMSGVTISWLFFGKQNVPADSYRIAPVAFEQQVQQFIATHRGDDGRVHVPPGTDAYIMGAQYMFYPELVLKAGHEYKVWISAKDTLHGFSIVGGGQNINLQIAPHHAYGATFTPDEPGTYLIVCNEYCGRGHHAMKGRLIVER